MPRTEKRPFFPRHASCSCRARDFASLRGTQVAASAALFAFSFFLVEILGSGGDCFQSWIFAWPLAKSSAAGKRQHFAVGWWEAGSADDSSTAPNSLTCSACAQLPPGRLERGQQLARKDLGPCRGATAGRCALVPVYQGGNMLKHC